MGEEEIPFNTGMAIFYYIAESKSGNPVTNPIFFKGVQIAIARGCGQCLNFNPTVIVILMMRKGLTWLRSTRFALLFPLDQHIELHKLCGWFIMLLSIIHTLGHIVNSSECLKSSVFIDRPHTLYSRQV